MRNILLACVLTLPLVACKSSTPVTEAKVVQDINLEAVGFNAALQNPAVAALVPAADLPKVQAALADLMAVDASILADPNSLLQKGNVQSVESDINTLLNALAALPLPPAEANAVSAAAILAPVIEAEINALVPASP